MRICLIASLNLPDKRSIERLNEVQLNKSSQRIQPSFFTKDNKRSLFSALLKLRYKDCDVDWRDNRTVARIVAQEIYSGLDYLMEESNLNAFLYAETAVVAPLTQFRLLNCLSVSMLIMSMQPSTSTAAM